MSGKSLVESLNQVRKIVEERARRTGRDPKEIMLLAVSKGQPDSKIEAALAAGQKFFGENYVQEMLPRIDKFPSAVWHFIGGLQSNKCKYIVGKVAMIHSVDRESLALEINKVAERQHLVQNILIQINFGNEDTKGGVAPADLKALLEKLKPLKGIKICGLMALPPLTENPEDSRKYFKELKALRDQFLPQGEMSIGTSHDFEIAIEEGATIVRVGTSVFGPRE